MKQQKKSFLRLAAEAHEKQSKLAKLIGQYEILRQLEKDVEKLKDENLENFQSVKKLIDVYIKKTFEFCLDFDKNNK